MTASKGDPYYEETLSEIKKKKNQFFLTLTRNVELIPIDLGLFSRTEQVSLH